MAESTRLSMDGMEWLKDKSLVEENLEKVRKLTVLANEIGTTMPKLAIAWCLKNENVSTAILGASKVSQLEETLTAIDDVQLLTTEVMEKIDGILDNEPFRPAF